MTTPELVVRIPCTTCGAMILPITAKHTDGLCRPCFRKTPKPPDTTWPAYSRNYRGFKFSDPDGLGRISTDPPNYDEMIAECEAMQRVIEFVKQNAPSDASVLVSGETGTGKKLVARMIPWLSKRKDRPFLAINGAALPDDLMESELFRSSLDGWPGRGPGRLESANGGTILIAEIADLSPRLQEKLLRVFQTGEISGFLTKKTITVDVRVLATTTQNLADSVAAGYFLPDLYNHISAAVTHLPPLRERREEIPRLLNYYLDRIVHSRGIDSKKIAPDVVDFLVSYPWPGNLRELQAVLEIGLLRSNGETVRMEDLPSEIRT